jgi:putative transcriptional regulator
MQEIELEKIIAGELALSSNVGETIKKWREIFKLSQKEISDAMGMASQILSDYEAGRRKNPTSEMIQKFVKALIAKEKERGSEILKKMLEEDSFSKYFDIHEFFVGLKGKAFAEIVGGKILAGAEKIEEMQLYGYTSIDSLKAITEVPAKEYMKMYGKTPMRALIFSQVETGRSTMIALKVSRAATEMKPSVVVLQGIVEDKVDPLAVKIAEAERLVLMVTKKPLEEIKSALSEFEGAT